MSILEYCICPRSGQREQTLSSYNGRSIGALTQRIPPIFVYRGIDGRFIILDGVPDGVPRATRVAKLQSGMLVRVEVIGELSVPCGHLPTVGEQRL